MQVNKPLFAAAERLQHHLERAHLRQGLLRGPDAGVRFNLRAWRFIKSAFPVLARHDEYIFTQTQLYWALSNWLLFDATRIGRYRDIAVDCAEGVLRLESDRGTWPYPLPERRHLIATLECMAGAATLLAAREPRATCLDGAVRAADFILNHIGFQPHDDGEAIDYFDRPRGKIPNNSVIAVWYFLRMQKATGDSRFVAHVPGLVRFVESVQLPTGEIPYIVEGPNERARPHYLCYQYNAFQFLYMAWAERLQPGTWKKESLARLARFIRGGVQANGACANDCSSAGAGGPETDYYTAALGAALHEAWRQGLLPDNEPASRCFARVLARQKPDGRFGFSTGDYGVLRDSQSYPRQQAMTLFHLLYACDLGDGFGPSERFTTEGAEDTERIL